jgi:hypothetical protein
MFFNNRSVLSLQIVVAAFVQTCLANWRLFPDPLDCHKFYERSESDCSFTLKNCTRGKVFDWHNNRCVRVYVSTGVDCTPVTVEGLQVQDCSDVLELGFHCNSDTSFTYCARNEMIAEHVTCPGTTTCSLANNHPCV